jgi:hypothetical protein
MYSVCRNLIGYWASGKRMQQAIQAEQTTGDTHGTSPRRAVPLNSFVINLCSSTSPVALAPPDHAGLKRFSFFVSRRREESRERFRLHMGYFDTQEEAEKLLDIVREIYPGAWAGLAPGQRLRGAAAHASDSPAPTVAAEVAPAQLDQLLDSTPAAAAQPIVPKPAVSAETAAEPTATVAVAVAAAPAAPIDAAPALVPDQSRRMVEDQSVKPEHEAAARSLNDVRAAIASLDDTSGRTPVLHPIPELKPLASAPIEAALVMSDRGVLAVLEQGSTAPTQPPVALTGPATTMMATALPPASNPVARQHAQDEAQPRNEKPYYAVQLMWSVQPMDIAQVPQLAIFSAYTLYGAEGNRDGRRWYGLRLGFFTDAVSARQVAHYVRSEFSTVSVVPVTPRERERAKRAAGQPTVTAIAAPKAATPTTPATRPKHEFDFIEDKEGAVSTATKSGSPRPAGRTAPGKRAKLRTQSAVPGRSKTKAMTLEETLEILGASELQMDDGRTPLINESGAALARAKPVKNKASRLGRLLERLSERIGS